MAKFKLPKTSTLRSPVLRTTRAHFFYVLIFSAFVLQIDAWKLITPEASLQRWTMAIIMLVVTTTCWYAARQRKSTESYYQAIMFGLIALDIYVAGFLVFAGRGMASRGVALFAIPIVLSAIISRPAIFATAAFSLAAYWFAAIKYFNLYPSEGYRIELYADLSFYGAAFFVLAALLYIIRSRDKIVD